MCGIIGFRSEKDFVQLKECLPLAVSSLTYRGPDDSGLFFLEKRGIGLGHTRLAIIDLSSKAHQPMESEDGKVCITYSGEIYNFRQLRHILQQKHYHFKGNSDTEVILKSYLEWGIDSFSNFTGMFALAIWDGRTNELILARDPIGVKPLYYHFSQGTLVFASELKALMAFKSFKRDIDPEAIPLFLHYQYIPTPKTIFKNTYKLTPGYYMVYNGDNLISEPFYNLPDMVTYSKTSIYPEEKGVAELDELLSTVISDYMISDVPLGALLSGGIDSSIVVALMQKLSTSPVRTFSMGFKEQAYNEAPWASKVAQYLGTDHTEFYVTPKDALDVIPHLPEIYDEPFADSSAIPTYLVCYVARSQVTAALSGDGGDEQFSGYVRYWSTRSMAAGFQALPRPIKRSMALLLQGIPSKWVERCYLPLREFLPQRFKVSNFPDKWQKLISLLDKTEIEEIYRMTISLWPEEDLIRLTGQKLPKGIYEEIFKKTEHWPLFSRMMRVDQKTYLPDAMLTKVDRASMAVSLEVRVPLLDSRILEYTSSLPEYLKYRNGTGKYLLKKLLAQHLPRQLFERPKMGFGIPIDSWFRSDLKPLLLDYLSPEQLKKEGLFDHKFVETKIKEHLSGDFNHQYRLWSLLMWEMWQERWIT